jgi:hypothetical protein
MDIQNILEQAKQRGLSAISNIRSSITPINQPQVTQQPIVQSPIPRPTFQAYQPAIQPAFQPIKSVISTSFMLKPETIKPPEIKVSPLTSQPIEKKPFELPKPSEIIFGDWAKTANKRIEMQFANEVNNFQNFIKTNLVPVITRFADTMEKTGPEISQLDIALAPPEKRKELITKLGEQQKAIGELQAQTGLTAVAAPNVLYNTFNKSIIQPSYQNFQLGVRESLTGQKPTPEEINLANQGNLNITLNNLLQRKVQETTPDMTLDQKLKVYENNTAYYATEVMDITASLIDPFMIAGLVEAGIKGVTKLATKNPARFADELAAQETRISEAIIKNDIPAIEKEIGKPLNEVQLSKIEEINNIPVTQEIKDSLIQSRKIEPTMQTKVEELNNAARQKFAKIIEQIKPKVDETTAWNRAYNSAREIDRANAAGRLTLREASEATWYSIVNSLYSRRAIVNDTIDSLVKSGVELQPSKNPVLLANAMNNTGLQTDVALKDLGFWGAVQEAVKANTNILKKKEVPADFGNFLAARRKTTLADLGIQANPNYSEDANFVINNAAKYKVAAEQFDSFVSRFVDKLLEANLISPERAKEIKQNKDYAPFKVVVNQVLEKRKIKLMEKKIDVASDKVVKTLEDFETNIVENPLETMQQLVATYVSEKARNDYTKSFGELVRQGLIPDAYIIRDAKNVRLREYYNSTIENIKDTTDSLEKIFKRDKKAYKKVFKEVNDLNKTGYNTVTFQKTTQEDSKFAQAVSRKIENRLNKRQDLLGEIENTYQDILKAKQNGEQVLKDKQFLNRTQKLLDRRAEWVQDLVTIGADALGKQRKGLMATGAKVPNLTARKEFIATASQQDVFNYVVDLYNLPYEDFKQLFRKAESLNLNIKSVLKEIQDIRNARTTNILVNSLVSSPQKDVEKLIGRVGKKQSDINSLMGEIRTLDMNRYKNDLVNSLIKNTPDELEAIQRKLQKKYPVLNEMIDNILEQQTKIDQNKGILKQLQEEEKIIRDLPKKGLTTISWLNNGVTEIAAIPKKLEGSFIEDMAMSGLYNSAVFRALENFTSGFFKTVLTGINPKSKISQMYKQMTQIAFMSEKGTRFKTLNPYDYFAKSMKDVWTETPEYKQFVSVGGGYSKYNFGQAADDLTRFAKVGGNLKTLKFSQLENIAGLDEKASRFQIWKAYNDKYIKEGMSEIDANYKAIGDVNNILPNYGEQGVYTRLVEVLFPFFRITLQSANVLGRSLKKDPAGTLFKIGTRIALPATIVTAFNNATPEQRRAYNDLTDEQKKTGIIIVPTNPKQDEKGKWIVYHIPVEETLMNFYNPVRRGIEAGINNGENWMFSLANEVISPQALSNFTQGFTGLNIPYSEKSATQIGGQLNPVVRSPLELGLNKKFYTGGEVVPKNLQFPSSPFMEYDDSTTPLAKELGYKLNYSPKKIDYFMQNLAVGVVDYAEMGANQALQEAENSDVKKATGVNPVQQLIDTISLVKRGGGATTQQVYEQVKQMDSAKSVNNKVALELMQKGDLNALKDLVNNGNMTKEQFTAVENIYQKNQITANLTPTQKALYNLSGGEIQKILEKSPELANDIKVVTEAKAEEKKLKNIDTKGFDFAPSVRAGGGGGTGGGFKFGKPKALKIAKPKKPKAIRIKKPTLTKPKKVTLAKPKKLKALKVAKVKPLKKIKRF